MRFDPAHSYSHDLAPLWKQLLNSDELVSYEPDLELWVIAGHDLVRTALGDTQRFSSASALTPMAPLSVHAEEILDRLDIPAVAVTTDPPRHRAVQAPLAAVFAATAGRAERLWGDLVRRRADQLAGHLAESLTATPWPDVDLVELVSSRLPLLVMLDVLGIPADDYARIAAWADNFAALTFGQLDDEDQLSAANGLLALWDFCRDLVELRADSQLQSQPAGIISDLLRYRNGDDHRLTLPETAAQVLTLLLSGWESTAAALAHALDHALSDRTRWARLAVDEHYAVLHTEETLRHSPAVDSVQRITTTDVKLGGIVIPAGSRCLLLLGAANHDEQIFPEPQYFRPDRARLSQHLGFGAGTHACLGAALARLQITTALVVLARRLPELALTSDFERHYRPSTSLRQHTALPATLGTTGCPVAHGPLWSAGPR